MGSAGGVVGVWIETGKIIGIERVETVRVAKKLDRNSHGSSADVLLGNVFSSLKV